MQGAAVAAAGRAAAKVRLGASGVSRRFGRVVANDRVDLSVAPGSIHAVVGQNGAGKTTLMRILQGLDRPDEGHVVIDDAAVELTGPADALRRGVGMVHQELMLVPGLTLLENLVLGCEPLSAPLAPLGVVDWRRARAEAKALAGRARLSLDWDSRAERAPFNARQIVAILRLVYRGADTLILDEPTAVLAPAQVQDLFALLRDLQADGRTIVFISHKLAEVLAIADQVTVLRGGRVISTAQANTILAADLAEMILGRSVEPPRVSRSGPIGEPVFEVTDMAAFDDRGVRRLEGVDLAVRAGEIVGLAAVAGNGQDELVECLAGLRRPAAGRAAFAGEDVTGFDTAALRRRGIGYLSPDRAQEGLALPASLVDNMVAGRQRDRRFARAGWQRLAALRDFAQSLLQRFDVTHDAVDAAAATLSGGNQQRVALARELDREPRLLLASQPTRGIDVAGVAFVHRQLAAARDRGCAILLVSEELEELLSLSDRIVVLYRGRVAGSLSRDEATMQHLGALMTGSA